MYLNAFKCSKKIISQQNGSSKQSQGTSFCSLMLPFIGILIKIG